jgi:hypothetical protein
VGDHPVLPGTLKVEDTTVGTAIVSGNTLTMVLNAASGYPGTYTGTK